MACTSGALEDVAATLEVSSVPVLPVVVVTIVVVVVPVSPPTENQPMPLSLADVSVTGVSVGAGSVGAAGVTVVGVTGVTVAGVGDASATRVACRGERPLVSVVVAAAGAAAGVGEGRFRGDPTESLTTAAFANGSFAFVFEDAGAADRTECVSDTTGTRW